MAPFRRRRILGRSFAAPASSREQKEKALARAPGLQTAPSPGNVRANTRSPASSSRVAASSLQPTLRAVTKPLSFSFSTAHLCDSAGRWMWVAPLGYLNVNKKILIDGQRAPLVRKAFELIGNGEYAST